VRGFAVGYFSGGGAGSSERRDVMRQGPRLRGLHVQRPPFTKHAMHLAVDVSFTAN